MLFSLVLYLCTSLPIPLVTSIIPSNHSKIMYYFYVSIFSCFFLYEFYVFFTKSAFLNHLRLSLFNLFIYHRFSLYFVFLQHPTNCNYGMYFCKNMCLLRDEVCIIICFMKICIKTHYSSITYLLMQKYK